MKSRKSERHSEVLSSRLLSVAIGTLLNLELDLEVTEKEPGFKMVQIFPGSNNEALWTCRDLPVLVMASAVVLDPDLCGR